MAHEPMSDESKVEMHRYIMYRCQDENIVPDPARIGQWMADNIHELKDNALITAYLAAKDTE